ncbi:hypothetical protein A9R01_02855 ['Osedax' symbiont bacterium Rs2_46_30_T18]|nr:hypothetical protein A9R01_02855 ['Osedax' symbiont bacterium Rs2_46_30_T18]
MPVVKVVIAVVILAGVAVFAFQDQLVNKFINKRIAERLNGVVLQQFTNTLSVVICGAGSPIPDPQRSGSCALVIAGDQVLMIDAGSGVSQVSAMGISLGLVDNVFLTHFHSDHINSLGELMTQRWANSGKDFPLAVHGPNGTNTIVNGFNMAYGSDRSYREAHHTTAVMPPQGGLAQAHAFKLPPAEGLVVLEKSGLKVTAFAVDHSPVDPAVGYKFEYQGHSLVFSGDTAKSLVVQKFAKGSDVLIHEALSTPIVNMITTVASQENKPRVVKITQDILDYHTSPVEAAQVAQGANVPFLLFSHIVPQLPINNLKKRFVEGVADAYDGEFSIAQDGSFVSIDLKDGSISHGDLLN